MKLLEFVMKWVTAVLGITIIGIISVIVLIIAILVNLIV